MDAIVSSDTAERPEGAWALPEGWCWTTLGAAATVIAGQSPPSETYNEEAQGLPFFQGKAEFTERHPSVRKWCTAPTKIAEPNDILISVRAPVGPTNVADVTCGIGRGLAAIRNNKSAEMQWILHWLRFSQHKLAARGTGTTFAAITGDILREHAIPLAPLAEQKRIVARVEAMFAAIAEGEAALAEARKGLDTFRRALLKAAVTGELTKDWREKNPVTETGHDLLAHIRAERASSSQTKNRGMRAVESAELDAFALPNLPDGWAWTPLGKLFDVTTGSTPSRSDLQLWNGGIPWVSSGEVAFCRIRSTRETISELGLGNRATRLNPVGTVLLAMIGEGKTRGQCAILEIPAANNQNVAAIKVASTPIPSEFVYHVLEERYFKSRRESQGGNQPALNGGKVAEMPIPLPPLGEITEILRRVSEVLSTADDTRALLDAEAADVARLKQSILKAAFEGRLVPQDPSDVPASVTLARLRSKSSPLKAQRGRSKSTKPRELS